MNYKVGRSIGQFLFFLSICLLCIAVFFNLSGIIVPILVIAGILAALAGLIVYFLFLEMSLLPQKPPHKVHVRYRFLPELRKETRLSNSPQG